MSYAASQQALEDYAMLLPVLRKQFGVPSESATVAFGGSYGGMLAAWGRFKYPNVFHGAIAASAPIWGFPLLYPPIDGAAEAITNSASAKGGASDSCKDNILSAWPVLAALAKSEQGRKTINEALKLCSPMQEESQLPQLFEYLQTPWFNLAEADYPFPSNYITFALDNGIEPLPPWPGQLSPRVDLFLPYFIICLS